MRHISIFLSYSRRNSTLAVDLQCALEAAGAAVWRDQEKLYAGAKWPKDLGDAIAARDALVLVWSTSAAQSKFVELEWCTALALGKPVLPYLLDETPLPPVLASFHGVVAQTLDRDAPLLIQRLQNQPQTVRQSSSWLLTALEGIPAGEPEQAFRTVRAMLTGAAAHTTGGAITAFRDGGSAPFPFRAGEVIADRYEIKSLLGRGGMGQVWQAFDLKLRVDVALKVLHGATDEQSIEALRGEVRIAREVISPNVCRIFDLGEANGTEFLSMEYVDGRTLSELMAEKGPFRLEQASPLASQLLSSLQAIHEAGLVHRDVKPENLMVTRTGRLVVMDLGLARFRSDDGIYSFSGTPAYMSPEQLRGNQVSARSDVYAAAVVLAELTAPAGARNLPERQAVWSGIQQDPPSLPDTPWARVLAKAVARDPDLRYPTAQAVARALEKETVRTIGEQDASPYPGLAAFTEADADYFFGREAEIEALWKKLTGQPRLLAVVGPSGAGKSSFLRAGVLAARPEGWSTLRISPGGSPFVALGQAVARAIPGDPLLAEQMVRFNESDVAVEVISRWAASQDEALLIVDQFEELFTQNPGAVQEDFARLLARLPVEAGVHVLLGMRDDFLMACHRYEHLTPIFSELTPLEAPSGADLRRAIVQPALQCGFRFEDDSLVDEMIAAVEGERGALPLLAFACARLWEGRDRKQGLLTRSVYLGIGGVAGALAGHAEATLERIGADRLPLVRELFRNLVTSQGTRAEQEREELLSVFPEEVRPAAADVLDALIDARLLVSYEDQTGDAKRHRIEIIHESLLETWPRLVRWRTRDADAALMRDQLRQAARLWEARDRSVDLLWSGTAYREFDLWREQYPGRLTDTEQAFARAMVDHANRRRRVRRVAVSAAFVGLLLVIGVVGRLWQQSEEARHATEQARQETQSALARSEANRLVALGRLSELERNPSAAIGYAIASLERADADEARLLALDALWRGPTALVFDDAGPEFRAPWRTKFSPDGRWLAAAGVGGELVLYARDGGSSPKHAWRAHEGTPQFLLFSLDSSWLWTGSFNPKERAWELKFWSIPEGRLLLEDRVPWPTQAGYDQEGISVIWLRDDAPQVARVSLLGTAPAVERMESGIPAPEDPAGWLRTAMIDPEARWLAAVDDGTLVVRPLGRNPAESRRLQVEVERIAQLNIRGDLLAVGFDSGAIDVFSLEAVNPDPLLTVTGPANPDRVRLFPKQGALSSRKADSRDMRWWWFGPQGPVARDLKFGADAVFQNVDREVTQIAGTSLDGTGRIWPLRGPETAVPIVLRRGDVTQLNELDFHPRDPWLVVADSAGVSLRPLNGPTAKVIWQSESTVDGLVFAPDGNWLAVGGLNRTRIWPLQSEPLPPAWELLSAPILPTSLDTDRAGQWIVVAADSGDTKLVSLRDQQVVDLEGFDSQTRWAAMSPNGRLAAATGGQFVEAERQIRIWDVESGAERVVLDAPDGQVQGYIEFCGDGDNLHLYSSSPGQFWKWDLATGTAKSVWSNDTTNYGEIQCLADGRVVAVNSNDEKQLVLIDLGSGEQSILGGHPLENATAIHPSGNIVATGDGAGVIRVSRVGDAAPHLLLGHTAAIKNLAFDPAGRWIASVSEDRSVRLWPMPELSRTPFHELPREELLAHLKALTNYRVVVDESQPSGFGVTLEPFDGWETIPEWW